MSVYIPLLLEQLTEVETLLADIDNNPLHPANDARHPEHAISVQVYQALADWCQGQRDRHEDELRAWQRAYYRTAKPVIFRHAHDKSRLVSNIWVQVGGILSGYSVSHIFTTTD